MVWQHYENSLDTGDHLMAVSEGDWLWSPNEKRISESNLADFAAWLVDNRGKSFADYDQLWRWSVDCIEEFWGAVWDYYEIISDEPYSVVLPERVMPGADWFPGTHLNFAEHILRNERPDAIALHAYSETGEPRKVSWEQLGAQVRILAEKLRGMGVVKGDRIVSYLPNSPEAVVAFLASASVGAIFSSCSPDFGYQSVLDRFQQIEPKVMFFTDGYQFGGKEFDRRQEVARIIAALGSLECVVQVPNLYPAGQRIVDSALLWGELLAGEAVSKENFKFERVPFNHPLWVLYSSGTTGLPKAIVHSHGGITLEFLKMAGFHMNLKPGSSNFFFTTTGWMMWNLTVGTMVTGCAAVLYDGNPIGTDPEVLWRLAEDSGTTFFGSSPTFVATMKKLGIVPGEQFDLSRLEGVLLGGSPADPDVMAWFYDNVKPDLWVTSQSGGTDICSAFVGASPTLPVFAGEIQTRCLGVDVRALDESGNELVDEVGELVVCKPMPSMPIFFWNDKEDIRYRESYFEDYPGLWRHGDYFRVNPRGGCFIYGRSDSTLNRYGVRIGTAEIYRVVEALPEIEDSLIVNLSLPEGRFVMPLFVKLKGELELDELLRQKICTALKSEYSPRHVPDKIIQIDSVPYTLTNKKLEVPVRKILSGISPEVAANPDAMANPDSLKFFINQKDSIAQ